MTILSYRRRQSAWAGAGEPAGRGRAAGSPPPGATTPGDAGKPASDDVQDAEYEVKK